jgi:hypothetical protein
LKARLLGRAISLYSKELAHFSYNDAQGLMRQKKAKKCRDNGTVNKLSTKRGKTGSPLGPVGGYNGGQGWQVPPLSKKAGYRVLLVLLV